ncbi:MAG: CapA family protein [Clostridia bacterium]|nr:CapA family protein [Clostridia bacterium]
MRKILCLVFALLLMLCACAKEPVKVEGGKETNFYVSGFDDAKPADTEEAPEKEDTVSRLSFVCAGDNIIYQCGFTDAKNRANEEYPEYNFTPIYENLLPEIQAADLAYINQETLMSGAEYGYTDYPCFNSPQHLGDQLTEMGFDIVNIANNHMLDTTTKGLLDTIEYWRTKDVTLLGGYENEDVYNTPVIIEKNGISMVFLSYTYATNGFVPSSQYDVVVPYLEKEQLVEDIRRVKNEADTLIVSVHWGNENQFEPTAEQRELAQVMCDEGVDVIIGTHPHVIQPVEWIDSSNGNKTLCIYSLGDVVAVMTRAANMLGGLCSFDIVKTNGDISIENVLFTPVVHHFGPSYYNGKMYYLFDFTDDLAATFGKVYGISANKETLTAIVKDVIDEEFLPKEAE